MTKALLALHVIAAILAVGPVAVAASMFPATARRAGAAAPIEAADTTGETATATPEQPAHHAHLILLHRICSVYAVLAVAVPVLGFATAASLHVLGSAWLVASMGLTAAAAFVLGAVILPAQQRVLGAVGQGQHDRALYARLAGATGLFNLLWASVTILMILRPGSTTGV